MGHLNINNRIGITTDQPIYIKRGDLFKFMKCENIILGDYFVHPDGTLEEINNITWVPVPSGTEPVYRLDVEEVDTYFADNVLVHNK